MKLKRLMILIILFLNNCFIANQIFAMPIDKIISFGDSLTDNGNLLSLTVEAKKILTSVPAIPNDPYYQGRFSNGPVWVDGLAKALNVPLEDFAYGGAWAEPYSESKLLIPFDLHMQVNFFIVKSMTDFKKENHLYTIWIGGNDYMDGRADEEYATTNTVTMIEKAIKKLVSYGAQRIMVLNLPDLGQVPWSILKGKEFMRNLSHLTQLHNQKLASLIANLKLKYPRVQFFELDIATYFEQMRHGGLHDALTHNYKFIKNVRDACYNGGYYFGLSLSADQALNAAKQNKIDINNTPALKIAYINSRFQVLKNIKPCDNPDEYFFWDLIHPSRIVHASLTEIASNMLAKAKIH